MPRKGLRSTSGTPIQSISRRIQASSSLALIGPPKITAPSCAAMVEGKGIAEARAADVELIAALLEQAPDAAGRRVLLVQNDEDLPRATRRSKNLFLTIVLSDGYRIVKA